MTIYFYFLVVELWGLQQIKPEVDFVIISTLEKKEDLGLALAISANCFFIHSGAFTGSMHFPCILL